jgi:hypothetical protein
MTVHLLPIPVAREELDLRLRSIGMPPEAIVVVEMLGPLNDLDHRLAGVVWKVIGREVPPTEDIPDYPFLRLSHGGAPCRQVQIWEWHICLVTTPAFAVYRWHPEGDEQLHFLGLSQHPTERVRQCKRLSHLVEVTKYRYKLGRPFDSGAIRHEELHGMIVPVIESLWREGVRPTQPRVLAQLPRRIKMGDRRLRQLCEEAGFPKWDPFIEGIRQEMIARGDLLSY